MVDAQQKAVGGREFEAYAGAAWMGGLDGNAAAVELLARHAAMPGARWKMRPDAFF